MKTLLNTTHCQCPQKSIKLRYDGEIAGLLLALPVWAIIVTGALVPGEARAKVTGSCSNCHTMHNSQNGADLNAAPNARLTNADCVGCHSSDTGDTIITVGGTRIPIVLNTGGYPAQPLAGGNFYWTSQGHDYDGYGHNVRGIAEVDETLDMAPGYNKSCLGNVGCHYTLVEPWDDRRTGCQGCHFSTFHHTDNGNYRFLNGHEMAEYVVYGGEDPDWEQNPSLNASNRYKEEEYGISTYCAACHGDFHGTANTQSGGFFIRHPTTILLPGGGEYGNYDPTSTYSNLAPVAYTDPSSPTRETAMVMCLSCHRPHGSEYPDMLRWDYDVCEAGTDDAACGCFVCHSTKDAG